MPTNVVQGRCLVAGTGHGPFLRLAAPISFWGGVDPVTGLVSDPRHPDHGTSLSGCVVWIPSTIGSSSSSSILLELVRSGRAPAALLLGRADPILALGAIVAREMGYKAPPMVEVPEGALPAWSAGGTLQVSQDGLITGPLLLARPRQPWDLSGC